MAKQRKVTYVIGTALDLTPITVTHVLADDDGPAKSACSHNLESRQLSKGFHSVSKNRKTCSHAQKDARVRHQQSLNKK